MVKHSSPHGKYVPFWHTPTVCPRVHFPWNPHSNPCHDRYLSPVWLVIQIILHHIKSLFFWYVVRYQKPSEKTIRNHQKPKLSTLPGKVFKEASPEVVRYRLGIWEGPIEAERWVFGFFWTKMGMDQYLLIPFLVGWPSILTQLFWCELQGYYWFWPIPKSIRIISSWRCWGPRWFCFDRTRALVGWCLCGSGMALMRRDCTCWQMGG